MKAQPIAGLIRDPARRQIEFTSPSNAGPYRPFVTATDGQAHVAYGNIPFLAAKERTSHTSRQSSQDK